MSQVSGSFTRWRLGLVLAAQVICPLVVLARPASPSEPVETPLESPSEYGFRLTPGVARGMAYEFTTSLLVGRYGLDRDKSEQATELVARRLLETAHKLDGPLQLLVERCLEEQLEALTQEPWGGPGSALNHIPPAFRAEFAERLAPMMPAVRELAVNVTRDVRPMLPAAQQLKMAGDMIAFHAAFDAFDHVVQKWSRGESVDDDDPLRAVRRKVMRATHGESEELANCRGLAQRIVDLGGSAKWEAYVSDAKAFYQLDEAQSATADSVLREVLKRARAAAANENWRAKLYCNRLWYLVLFQDSEDRLELVRILVQDEYDDLMKPISELEDELKARIDRIPTQAQRAAAAESVRAWLEEDGFRED